MTRMKAKHFLGKVSHTRTLPNSSPIQNGAAKTIGNPVMHAKPAVDDTFNSTRHNIQGLGEKKVGAHLAAFDLQTKSELEGGVSRFCHIKGGPGLCIAI